MRLLLDECVDERLRHLFSPHDCQSARYAKVAGLKNGELIAAAEQAGFEVIVTTGRFHSSKVSLVAPLPCLSYKAPRIGSKI